MKLKENNSAQKLRGAYYTPLPLAEMMVKLFSSDESIKTVLEPSCGDGEEVDLKCILKTAPFLAGL